ncbi:Menaquinol-cytochrome c reductase cytochrome b subunit [Aquisphaera giovannonii]|uniref:Menaquinol-cytochrome c reductase cytochrome b subunit n=1 Tax=Aquisphaera giovannonii TaxID=406548 RepID=A0A5B9W051_9BACT|nr:cytochrome b N-terminal domain-containing protein [Aquisphaera giovannonii]QEH33619.1 Menaquinol-cytochrome c reductase cytochrome b subunit [Aquisphaera giovannonii]
MRNPLADWINERTGYRAFARTFSDQVMPGGARWRYVFGTTLATVFLVQAFSGLMMMLAYSPSSNSAWGSVYYISNVMWMGWIIRGLHHFGAQTVMVLLGMHLVQTLLSGAYRKPREVNWWLGLALFVLVVGFGHTGYQLPWDQKGYWATKVVTNIMGGAPVVGPYIKTIVVGGNDYGNQTLTRFYGLHVGVLPVLLFLCLAAHVYLAKRHGLTPPAHVAPGREENYYPAQTFRNTAVSALVVAIMMGLVLYHGGAPLDAPADPSTPDYPARPEWFFLSLFQMLKSFPGRLEWVGSIVIPGSILTVLALLPLLEKVLPWKVLHFLACMFLFVLVGGAGYFTAAALWSDAHDEGFKEARRKADAAEARARFLASSPQAGIPPDGAGFLLRRDPFTEGKAVLEKKCMSCHVLDGQVAGEQSAADLTDFGSRAWIRGLLEEPSSAKYYGKVAKCDGMAEWKKTSKLTAKELDDVADFVASFAKIPADITPDEWLSDETVVKHPGSEPFQKECGKCHVIDGYTEGGVRDSPRLFAWGSPQWTERMIRKPGAPDLYGYLDPQFQMPAFGRDQLTEDDLKAMIRYLRGDYPMPMDRSSKAASPEAAGNVPAAAGHLP